MVLKNIKKLGLIGIILANALTFCESPPNPLYIPQPKRFEPLKPIPKIKKEDYCELVTLPNDSLVYGIKKINYTGRTPKQEILSNDPNVVEKSRITGKVLNVGVLKRSEKSIDVSLYNINNNVNQNALAKKLLMQANNETKIPEKKENKLVTLTIETNNNQTKEYTMQIKSSDKN